MKLPLFAILSLSLFLASLQGQDPRGFIRGTLTDSTGGAIPGVRVRATASDTGVSAVAVSNEAGLYNIPYLLPGMYKLTVEQTGFKSFVRNNVEVRVSETVEVPITLEVGSLTEMVEVRDTTPQLETASSTLGMVMDQRRITDLPQRGANPLELTLLAPGVANTTNLRLRKSMAPEATSDFAADGAGRYNNEFQIDGISNTAADRGQGYARVAYAPPASAVREFKMQTSAYDASVGHTMGSIVTSPPRPEPTTSMVKATGSFATLPSTRPTSSTTKTTPHGPSTRTTATDSRSEDLSGSPGSTTAGIGPSSSSPSKGTSSACPLNSPALSLLPLNVPEIFPLCSPWPVPTTRSTIPSPPSLLRMAAFPAHPLLETSFPPLAWIASV